MPDNEPNPNARTNAYEVYEHHAAEYHALVSAEDHEGRLRGEIQSLLDWKNTRVLEAGTGTGRVTQWYVDRIRSAVLCDRSLHMLEFAAKSLEPHAHKLTFLVADNRQLPELEEKCDVFLEGWSIGHCITDCTSAAGVKATTAVLVDNARKNLIPGGTAILIETMGTNVDAPGAPNDRLAQFYEELEGKHGFEHRLIRTDYRFDSPERAAEVLAFFFGEEMGRRVSDKGDRVIPEWTGVWTRRA